MSYTVLRVIDSGVVLFAEHARRLSADKGKALEAFRAFAQSVAPGVYRVDWRDGTLHHTLHEGEAPQANQPVRFVVSPFAGAVGLIPKPGPPNAYEAVRVPGVTTLLTSADGGELLESCSAALVGWNGEAFVLPPDDRPHVDSTSVRALRRLFPTVCAPLLKEGWLPLFVMNAVRGPMALELPGHESIPYAVLKSLERVFEAVRP